jgi:hypothetical protein
LLFQRFNIRASKRIKGDKPFQTADDKEVDSLIGIMEQFPGADIFGSIPCDPWSARQRVNCKRYGKKFQKKLEKNVEANQ